MLKHKDAERFEFWISTRNREILEKTSKRINKPMSYILNHLIYKHLDDPIAVLVEEKRSLAKRIYEITSEIEHLEEMSRAEALNPRPVSTKPLIEEVGR